MGQQTLFGWRNVKWLRWPNEEMIIGPLMAERWMPTLYTNDGPTLLQQWALCWRNVGSDCWPLVGTMYIL
jgi:hypothetical protein